MKPSVIKTHLTCLRKYPDIISRMTKARSQWSFSGEGGRALRISWGLFIGCIFLFMQVDRRITSVSGVISVSMLGEEAFEYVRGLFIGSIFLFTGR